MLGNLQNKIIQALQSQSNNLFFRPHICWCVCVYVAFYLKWSFGRQGRGLESGSWFLRDVGLSPHLGL